MKLLELLKQLRAKQIEADAYIDNIPNEYRFIGDVVYDNDYANCIGIQKDLLTEYVFSDFKETVYWFLYDFKPHPTKVQIVDVDGNEHIFPDDEAFYVYFMGLNDEVRRFESKY